MGSTDYTAAERKRRQRARQKYNPDVTPVTPQCHAYVTPYPTEKPTTVTPVTPLPNITSSLSSFLAKPSISPREEDLREEYGREGGGGLFEMPFLPSPRCYVAGAKKGLERVQVDEQWSKMLGYIAWKNFPMPRDLITSFCQWWLPKAIEIEASRNDNPTHQAVRERRHVREALQSVRNENDTDQMRSGDNSRLHRPSASVIPYPGGTRGKGVGGKHGDVIDAIFARSGARGNK